MRVGPSLLQPPCGNRLPSLFLALFLVRATKYKLWTHPLPLVYVEELLPFVSRAACVGGVRAERVVPRPPVPIIPGNLGQRFPSLLLVPQELFLRPQRTKKHQRGASTPLSPPGRGLSSSHRGGTVPFGPSFHTAPRVD